MLFRQLFDQTSYTYTYLIASDYQSEAIIIDPVKEKLDLYCQLIKEFGLTLKYSVETHVHADHVTAASSLREKTNCQLAIGKQAKLDCVDILLNDQQEIKIQGISLTALHTPGHTDDSYCFLMNDRVFTGDTLLIRGTGRTDFQHGDAIQHYHSIKEKLFTLPDDTLVYPAHDYKGMLCSTIGEEKQFNPRLQAATPEAYAEIMGNLNLPKPKLIDIAVPANQRGGES